MKTEVDTVSNTTSNKDSEQKGSEASQKAPVREPSIPILPRSNITTSLLSVLQTTRGTIFFLIILLALPVTIVLLSREQDVRQRADFTVTPIPTPQTYNISGKVYKDTNNNGSRDSWEDGFEGIKVIITGANVNISTVTNRNGNYSYETYGGLLAGSYTVRVLVPEGYTNVTPTLFNFTLGPNDAIVDFGINKK